MKLAVLIENNISDDTDKTLNLETIHGLSLYIETMDQKILLDVGKDGKYAANARKMAIDISDVDTVIISHGHADHGGGLDHFFSANSKARVYMHREAVPPHYSRKKDGSNVPIGLDRKLINKYKERITFIDKTTDIGEGLKIYENIPENFPRPITNGNLSRLEGESIVPDNFRHELILNIEENDKNFIMTGCSHSGIVNMVNLVKTDRPENKIAAVFGGFHLHSGGQNLDVPKDYLLSLIEELKKFNCNFYTGHCTGERNFQVIKKDMGEALKGMNTGLVLHL